MFKKILSVICSAAVSISAFTFNINTYAQDFEYVMNETFDGTYGKNGALLSGGYFIGGHSDQKYGDFNIVTDGDNKYLSQTLTAKNQNARQIYMAVPEAEISGERYQVAEADIMLRQNDEATQASARVSFLLGSGWNKGDYSAVVLRIFTKKIIICSDYGSKSTQLNYADYGIKDYNTDGTDWRNIKAVYDKKEKTYDLYFEGKLIATDAVCDAYDYNGNIFPAMEEMGIGTVCYNTNGNIGYGSGIDNIKVYGASAQNANNMMKDGIEQLLSYNEIYTESFLLPYNGYGGRGAQAEASKISYETDNAASVYLTDTREAFMPGETKITCNNMPLSETDDDVPVNLTVNIRRTEPEQGEETLTCTYPLVFSFLTDKKVVKRDAALLDISKLTDEKPDKITKSFSLPQEGESGSAITWGSSDPDVIEADANTAVVKRGSSDAAVTLTASFAYGSETFQKDYEFIVKASTEGKIIADEAAFDASVLTSLTKSFDLPSYGSVNNSKIVWSSDNAAVFIKGNRAIVNRPSFVLGNACVTLKAVYTLDGESREFAYPATVIALDEDDEDNKIINNCLHESFDTEFTPTATNPNLLIGGAIMANYNYRDGYANKSVYCVKSDDGRDCYLTQSLLPDAVDGNWRGFYLDVEKTPRSEYQLLEMDFKIGQKSGGLWLQTCDEAAGTTGTNAANKFVMLSITKNRLVLRNISSSYKSILLTEYNLSDLTRAEAWHNIKIVMDSKRYVYDVLIDDVLIATDVAAADDLSGKNFLTKRIYLSAQGLSAGNYVGFDDVKVQEISAGYANEIVKTGFDNLFLNGEIYKTSIELPFGGAFGAVPTSGEAKISYSTDNYKNVAITDTHYTSAAGSTYMSFSGMPASGEESIPFNLYVRSERPVEGKEPKVLAYTYKLSLSYLTDQKRTERDAALLKYTDITGDNTGSIVNDIILPQKGVNGSDITWQSSNTGAISNTGKVTRSETGDISVTMTATFLYNAAKATKDFSFVVKRSIIPKIIEDEAAFLKPDFSNITSSFSVPLKGAVNNSSISWFSDDASLFVKKDKILVTRPNFEDGDKTVKLTAVYTLNGETKAFEYTVTVKRFLSDDETVSNAYDKLLFEDISIDDANEIYHNFSLIGELGNGVVCTWNSSREDVIRTDGTVINPINSDDITVVLTAAIKKGSAFKTKSFAVKVKAFSNESELLEKAKTELVWSKLSDEPIDSVTEGISLPEDGFLGTKIIWSSDNNSVIYPYGKKGAVIRPPFEKGPSPVTLTAHITYGSSSTEKKFYVRVLEDDGFEVVFSTDNESENAIIGSMPVFEGIGKSRLENLDRGTVKVVYDPLDPSNKAVKFSRNAGLTNVCTLSYLTKFGDQNFETDYFSVKTRVMIPSDVKNQVNIYLMSYEALSGGMNDLLCITFEPDGSVYSTYSVSGAPVKLNVKDYKYNHDTWFDVEITGNTYTELFDLYIDNEKLSENGRILSGGVNSYDSSMGLPFYYYKDSSKAKNFYAIRYNHFGAPASEDSAGYYIDDTSVVRKIRYSEEMSRAMSEFDIDLLSKNNISSLHKDLIIPKINVSGVDITCMSGDKSIITNDGKINFKEEPQSVAFMVQFKDSSNVVAYKTYNLSIVSNKDPMYFDHITDIERVEKDLNKTVEDLKNTYNLANITSNVAFSNKGKYGSELRYTTSNEDVMTANGIITRGSADKNVKITVTAQFNEAKMVENLDFTVKAKVQGSTDIASDSGGRGGSSGTSITVGGAGTDSSVNKLQTGGFSDVKEDFWAYKEITDLYKRGIISGIGNNTFGKDNLLKREEFVKMIAGIIKDNVNSENINFVDVDTGAWYAPYITKAANAGIISGYGNGRFGVGDFITREDLAVVIYGAVKDKLKIIPSDVKFSDDELISEYAKDKIAALRGNAVMIGKENNKFEPKTYVTRAEAAVMIYRVLEWKQ